MLLDATPFSSSLNELTSLIVTFVVWEVVSWGNNTYSFQAQGDILCWGLFIERTTF
jgi:hypothetical protein